MGPPCFDWSLGLVLRSWPSKTEVIGALGIHKRQFLGMQNFVRKQLSLGWHEFIWLIFWGLGGSTFLGCILGVLFQTSRQRNRGPRKMRQLFTIQVPFVVAFFQKTCSTFQSKNWGNDFPLDESIRFAKPGRSSTTVEWDGHFRCVWRGFRAWQFCPKKAWKCSAGVCGERRWGDLRLSNR